MNSKGSVTLLIHFTCPHQIYRNVYPSNILSNFEVILVLRKQTNPPYIPSGEIDRLDTPLLVKHRCLLAHITVNRAVTHELVRHRVASYLQESQRYCRYGEERFGGEVQFVRPCFFEEGSREYELWEEAMKRTEALYLELLKTSSPQAARTVLPNSCKTEIMVHATLEEWQHIFRLRASKAADPSMREIMLMMLPEFEKRFQEVFSPVRKALEQG